MAVLESIFTNALTAPKKTAVITDGRVIGYRAYAAAIVRMRRFMEAQAIDRDQVAILCVGELASGWIIGLALRSLGVTTVYARTLEDVERLGFAAFTVVSSDVEVWPGLAAMAARVGAPGASRRRPRSTPATRRRSRSTRRRRSWRPNPVARSCSPRAPPASTRRC